MQRYFVPRTNWDKSQVTVTGEDSHHIVRVMRLRKDDHIICNHPDGKAAFCTIVEQDEKAVVTNIVYWLDEEVELPVQVTIAQGLPKGDKLEFVLQKGTELGASGFIPVQTERSIVVWDEKKIEKKHKRHQKIVKEASEQSHRNIIPSVHPLTDMEYLLHISKAYDMLIFAYEEEAKTNFSRSLSKMLKQLEVGSRVLLFIGPEGGFSTKEADKLQTNKFVPVRLGPRILRTETAAIYVLASISYQLEELGCSSCQQ